MDVERVPFRKYARLLLQLPTESRFILKYNPTKDWSWDKEIRSQILRELDNINCHLVNMGRKKGQKRARPQDLMQPDYVKEAKKKLSKGEKKAAVSEDELKKIEAFWKRRNPKAKFLGG